MYNKAKLDLFKNLLEAAGSDDVDANQRQESDTMSIKLEKEDLEAIMARAMTTAMSASANPVSAAAASARSGGDIDEQGELFAVSVKLSEFWTEDPEAWFDRAENQFYTRGIKEDATKFSHCVQALSYAQHKEVRALIRNPPKGTSYPALKEALCSAFSKTQLDKDTEFLNLKHLDNRDPRSVARQIDSLLEDPASLPRAGMINLLPQDVRMALATVEGLDTHHKVAAQAYKIINMKKDRSSVNVVESTPKEEDNEIDAIQKGRPQRGGRGSGGSARGGAGKQEKGEAFVCFAHKKFGMGAFSCKSGCSFAALPLARKEAGNGTAGR